jgi:hypothetical protein
MRRRQPGTRFELDLDRAADDHFSRRAHAVILVAVRVGGGDELVFGVTRDVRSA